MGADTMRAARAEPEAREAIREATAARSGFRECDEDDRKPKERAGAFDGGFRILNEAVAVEKEVGAAAAIALWPLGVYKEQLEM